MRGPAGWILSVLLLCALSACTATRSPTGLETGSSGATGSLEPSGAESVDSQASPPAAPSAAAGLAFVRLVGSVQQVFLVHADGDIVQLTNFSMDGNAGGAGPVAWSPDGHRIAVALGVPVSVEIAVVDVATGAVADLGPGGGGVPSWSPDGERLAYTAAFDVVGPGARIPVFVATPASGTVEEIGWGFAPVWHPSGERMVVSRSEGETETSPGTPVLVYLEADGSGESRFLTGYSRAVWSPDGSRLALERNGPSALLLADADGANPAPLAEGTLLAWSPDGTRLAYAQPESSTVVLVDVESGRRTDTGVSGGPAAWSPDGALIAIGSYDSARNANVVVLLDASTGARLGQVDGMGPAWAP
jgi:Tol biopolymer transport system component